MFLLSDDELEFLQLFFMLRAGRDQVNAGGREAGMPQDVRQLDHVPGQAVKRPGKQVAEVVGEDLPRVDAGHAGKGLHLGPDLPPGQRVPPPGAENRAGRDAVAAGVV